MFVVRAGPPINVRARVSVQGCAFSFAIDDDDDVMINGTLVEWFGNPWGQNIELGVAGPFTRSIEVGWH